MDNKRLIVLLLKRRSGELSLSEEAELNLLLGNEQTEETQDLMHFLEQPLRFENDVAREQSAIAFARVMQKTKLAPHNNRRIILRLAAVAASILLVLTLGIFYWDNREHPNEAQSVVTTKKGAKSTVLLPDGTKVWLNADSRISYDKTFGKKTRDIYLTGEACFDVAHNKSQPFIVHTKAMNVRVLGTIFNVRAYTEDKNTQTTLLRGSVEISLTQNAEKKIVLKPGEKLIVQNNYNAGHQLPSKTTNTPDIAILTIAADLKDTSTTETLWTRNKLAFDQEPLADIAKSLERWYNVTIHISDSATAGKKYSGAFENKSLEHVLEALKFTSGFHYTIQGNEVVIKE